MTTTTPTEQVDYAQQLVDQMAVSGDDGEYGLCALDILDNLACAGLRLTADPQGIASMAYMQCLRA